MEGAEDVGTLDVQGGEAKPGKRNWWHRFKELDFWNRILTIVAIFVLAQTAISAALQGIFDSLSSSDAGILDVYRNAAITFGSLAAIGFGWARAIENDARSRDDIVEAGEMFLRAAIFTLIALLFRAYALQNLSTPPVTEFNWQNVTGFIGLMVSVWLTVFVCLLDVLKGVVVVISVLQNRRSARKKGQPRG